MTNKKIITNTEKFVYKLLINEPTGHDWWHAVRVRNNAKHINKYEKGNWLVIELASLLHDVGDRKVIKKKNDDHSITSNFLKSQLLPDNIVDEVMFIVKNISYSKSLDSKNEYRPIEFQIVQDADRLDALGAIGIARTFAYGGSIGRSIYDPNIIPGNIVSTDKYKKHKTTSINHFNEKLFLLKDLLNTKSAREIANKRELYMKEYLNRFLDEWDGIA